MSKWLNQREDGKVEETTADPEQCSWMMNEICCNDECEECCSYPTDDTCEKCPFFTPEEDNRDDEETESTVFSRLF